MFDNIGSKIKGLAAAITWIGILASICVGFMFFVDEDTIFLGFIVMIVGSLASWISSFLLYGFGQLVENSDKLVSLYDRSAGASHAGNAEGQNSYVYRRDADTDRKSKLEQLEKLYVEDLITEEEFNQRKNNL